MDYLRDLDAAYNAIAQRLDRIIDMLEEMAPSEVATHAVTHSIPPIGSGVTPCCGKTLFELPRTANMTTDPALVTCK